jgi:hypothetical protein
MIRSQLNDISLKKHDLFFKKLKIFIIALLEIV